MARSDRYIMPNKRIEEYAMGLLGEYEAKYRCKVNYPVQIADILDCLFDFVVEVDDLQSTIGRDVLAALFIYKGERRIVVDTSIDAEVNASMRGRYNFSLAHEAGHWIIHAPKLLAMENTPDLVVAPGEPAIICRSSDKDENERQADRFAGYVLMPRELVRKAWIAEFGEDSPPVNVYEELEDLKQKFYTLRNDNKVFCEIARKFAKLFQVSAEAMQIRLSELGYIKLEEDHQGYLF